MRVRKKPRQTWTEVLLIAAIGIGFVAILVVVGGLITSLLWNWLVVSLLNVRQISIWEGIGVNFIVQILRTVYVRNAKGGSR